MLSQKVIEQNAQNRRSEKLPTPYTHITTKIAQKSYQDLIQWLQDVKSFMRTVYTVLFTSDAFSLIPTTKYLARVYLDQTLYNCLVFQNSQLVPLVLTCLSLAIKFHEVRSVSDIYNPEYIFGQAHLPVTKDEYFSLEIKVISALKFKFNYTTPYDYLPIFLELFPWYDNLGVAISEILDFTMALPKSCEFNAQELFFGTVEAIFQYKGIQLNQTQLKVLRSMTDCWPRASILSQLILFEVKSFFELLPNQ